MRMYQIYSKHIWSNESNNMITLKCHWLDSASMDAHPVVS